MIWKRNNPSGSFALCESIDIDRDVECVFGQCNRFERFPEFMASVRHMRRIDAEHVLWDVDIAGRQIMWEARVVERVPQKVLRWKSIWGAQNSGEVHFESLPGDRTRLTVGIEFVPHSAMDRLGARLGLVDLAVRHDLARFRRFVEGGGREPLDRLGVESGQAG